MSLQGKVALITGGAKNLGALIAQEFAAIGASLALHYNSERTKNDADKLGELLSQKFPNTKVSFYQGDLTTKAACDKLFDSVMKDFGKLDIVINTVGMVLKKPLAEVSEEEYDKMFEYVLDCLIVEQALISISINSKAAFFIMQGAAKNITDEGRIVSLVTALLGGFTGYYTPYAGSKAPVEHFTRGLSKELADRKITVNAVAPGPMDTRESTTTDVSGFVITADVP